MQGASEPTQPHSRPLPLAFCTVVATNYLPQALALLSSVRTHHPDVDLHVLVLDADDKTRAALAELKGLVVHGPSFLDLGDRAFLQLATIYDVVELATSIKPRYFLQLLLNYEKVVYLDPDTYIVSPLFELSPLLDSASALLTPHFLEPIPPGSAYISEIHCLTVGVYNLGFGAFSRRAVPLLEWWWSHLQFECLKYPLLGLFVDQKWMDLAPTLFETSPLKHYGYNVGPWNLHERPVRTARGQLLVGPKDDALRLWHFSGFDPEKPQDISERLNFDMSALGATNSEVDAIARNYAAEVLAARTLFPQTAPYRFATSSDGKTIPRRLRQVYREALLSQPAQDLPVPFLAEEAKRFATWRNNSRRQRHLIRITDSALSAKYAFPDAYDSFRKRYKPVFRRARATLLDASKVRR